MVLPLYLAMRAEEMNGAAPLPRHLGVYGPAAQLPPGAMLVLDDREPVRLDPASAMGAESVLLDFERKADADSIRTANELSQALPCPVAAPPGYLEDPACPVFLPPCPLHVPLTEHLRPWKDREIWLDVTLWQQVITVTRDGARYALPAPADRPDGGWFDDILLCRCMMETKDDQVCFTLFDTPETLKTKLEQAAALGITRAVGLYQELHFKL